METILIANLLLVFLVAPAAGFLFAYENDRAHSAFWLFAVSFAVSFWGWVIFVATHFIQKYW